MEASLRLVEGRGGGRAKRLFAVGGLLYALVFPPPPPVPLPLSSLPLYHAPLFRVKCHPLPPLLNQRLDALTCCRGNAGNVRGSTTGGDTGAHRDTRRDIREGNAVDTIDT